MGSKAEPNHEFYSSLPKTKYIGDEYLYQFHGFWFGRRSLQGARRVLSEFKPLSNDLILASFPKTGTTWLKSLLYCILNRTSKESLMTIHPHVLVPFLELQVYGLDITGPPRYPAAIASSSTRIFSTHIPYQILADTINSSDCRVVYVTRNPKDTVTSLWHFRNKWKEIEQQEPRPIEELVESFCSGTVHAGPYYDHVLGYHKESLERPEKIFFITYEELKNDPKTHVKRLAEFLGCPFEGENEEEEVEEIVRICGIETLKNYEVNKSNETPIWFPLPHNSYFRKGQVGDHKNYLSNEMIERIDATTLEKFHGSRFGFGFEFEFAAVAKDQQQAAAECNANGSKI